MHILCAVKGIFQKDLEPILAISNLGYIFPLDTRCFQIMGIDKRGGHRLKAIYLNLSELNIKFFIKHTRSVADKLIEIKKPPENLFISPRGT